MKDTQEQIEELSNKIDNTNNLVKQISSTVDKLSEKVDNIENKVETLENDTNDIKLTLEKIMINFKEFQEENEQVGFTQDLEEKEDLRDELEEQMETCLDNFKPMFQSQLDFVNKQIDSIKEKITNKSDIYELKDLEKFQGERLHDFYKYMEDNHIDGGEFYNSSDKDRRKIYKEFADENIEDWRSFNSSDSKIDPIDFSSSRRNLKPDDTPPTPPNTPKNKR